MIKIFIAINIFKFFGFASRRFNIKYVLIDKHIIEVAVLKS